MDSRVTVRKRKHLKLKGALTQCGLNLSVFKSLSKQLYTLETNFLALPFPQNSIEGYICLCEKLGSPKRIGSLLPLAVCEAKALLPKEDTSY